MRTPFTFRLAAGLVLAAAGPLALADISITRQPADATVSLGATASFAISASSTAGTLSYQWWFKDAGVDPTANPSATKATLTVTNLSLADAGPYFVVVSDAEGSVTSRVATLTADTTFTKITTGPGASQFLAGACRLWP